MRFELHLSSTDEFMVGVVGDKASEELIAHTHERSLSRFNKSLFSYVKNISTEEFNDLIRRIIKENYEGYHPNRTRGRP